MELEREDFETLTQISTALWADPEQAVNRTQEALAAVTLLNLTPARTLEKLVGALLEQVRTRRDTLPAVEQLNAPFFRLLPQERLILAALHLGHWSYSRLSKITGLSPEEIQRIAWQSRLHLGRQLPWPKGRGMPVPGGPSGATARACPAWHPQTPWTQPLLDDEVDSRRRVYLQNHLMACPDCMRTLAHSRDIYFAVEGHLHSAVGHTLPLPERERIAVGYERLWRRTRALQMRKILVWPSIQALFRRPDVIVVAGLAALLMLTHWIK